MNGKAGPVTIAVTSATTKTATTVPHATMIFVNPARAIAGCAMRRFVWVVQVSVTAVKNLSVNTAHTNALSVTAIVVRNVLKQPWKQGDFSGNTDELFLYYPQPVSSTRIPGVKARRVLVIGVGAGVNCLSGRPDFVEVN